MLATRKLTADRLKEVLVYSEDTGLFTRKFSVNQYREGTVSGHVCTTRNKQYVRVRIDGELIMGHVLAHLYVTGKWPVDEIDHIDGDGINNKWANLRVVSRLLNNQNTGKRRDNTLGAVGVARQSNGTYYAKIAFNKVKYHLGTYTTMEEASRVYEAAKKDFDFGVSHGKEQT